MNIRVVPYIDDNGLKQAALVDNVTNEVIARDMTEANANLFAEAMKASPTHIAEALAVLTREASRWESLEKTKAYELEAVRRDAKRLAVKLHGLPTKWLDGEMVVERESVLTALKENGFGLPE